MNSRKDTTTLPKPQHLNESVPGRPPRQLHQEFSWVPGAFADSREAWFTAIAMDIARGANVAIDLAMSSNMSRNNNQTPTLDEDRSEQMLLLALRSLEMLGDVADERLMRLHKVAHEAAAQPDGAQA